MYELVTAAAHDSNHNPLAQELAATVFWMACAWFGGMWQRRLDINSTKR